MTLFDLYLALFSTLDYTYGNTFYFDDKEIIFFKNIMGASNLNSEKNNSFLQAILCEDLYLALCGSTEGDIQLNTRRSYITKGGYSSKNSLSPKKLIAEFVKKDPSAILSDELKRIEDLIDITAKISCCGLTEQKTGYYTLSYSVKEKATITDKFKVKLKKELSVAFNKECKKIVERFNLCHASENNIEVFIACAILMIVFDNADYKNTYLSGDDEAVIVEKIRQFALTCITENNCDAAEIHLDSIIKSPKFSMPEHFIERHKELENLCQNAFNSGHCKIHAIIGEHGLGKSTLCQQYANQMVSSGKFRYVYLTFKDSLKATVASLENEKAEKTDIDKRFKINLEYLAAEQKRADLLLIIDNYDNPKYKEELAFDNHEYLELIKTGCNILITTTSDLFQCYGFETKNITYLSRLSTEELICLFYDVRGSRKENEYDVRDLIENYLLRNTYLVVLSAELAAQGMSAREIIDAFASLHIDETENITTHKDGRRYDERTLLNHFCCALDNNNIINPEDDCERAETHGVLGVLSLIPIGGMPEREFNDIAYPYKKRKVFTKIISRLKNHNLIFKSDGRIYLQPVVKEYIAREILLFGEDTYAYLLALTKQLDVKSFDAEMLHWVKIAESAYQIVSDEHIVEGAIERTAEFDSKIARFSMANEVIGGATILLSAIVRCYSAVNMYEKAYECGKLAYEGLQNIEQAMTLPFFLLTLATCYSIVAHAYLHGDPRFHKKNMEYALKCIGKCDELAARASESEEEADNTRILLSKLDGEIAAYYIKNKEYEKALERHMRALREREQLIESDPGNDLYRSMIAFTYRGIGTDYYYMSLLDDNKANYLRLSYENHCKSVEIFNELYGPSRLETVTSVNRMVGAIIELMKYADPNKQNEFAMNAKGYLSDNFNFYSCGDSSANREMADSIKKVREICCIIEKNDAVNEFAKEVIETVSAITNADEQCKSELELLRKVVCF